MTKSHRKPLKERGGPLPAPKLRKLPMVKLTGPRKTLLDFLCERGGEVRGKILTTPQRRLASLMQHDGLVRWEPTFRTKSLDRWTLRVTVDGLRALGEIR